MFRKLLINQTDHHLVQLFRYGLVVAVAAPIDLGGYILLKEWFHMYYVLAATTSFTLSLIANYILSVKWVWTNHTGRQRHWDAIMFAIIGFVGLGLTDLIVWVCTGFIHFNYIVSKLIAFSIVFFWSFGARRILFRKQLSEIFHLDGFRA